MDDEHKQERQERDPWHQNTVSWGQFLLALTVAISGVVTAIFWDRLQLDRRMTVVEEQLRHTANAVLRDQLDMQAFRAKIDTKLDGIQAQLGQVIVELARHQATSDRIEDMERREQRGLRLPKAP